MNDTLKTYLGPEHCEALARIARAVGTDDLVEAAGRVDRLVAEQEQYYDAIERLVVITRDIVKIGGERKKDSELIHKVFTDIWVIIKESLEGKDDDE